MSHPTICRGCGSVMPATGAHTCGCLDACCDFPAKVTASAAPESSIQNSGLLAESARSSVSPATFEPAPAPIQTMSEAEHNRFPRGRY